MQVTQAKRKLTYTKWWCVLFRWLIFLAATYTQKHTYSSAVSSRMRAYHLQLCGFFFLIKMFIRLIEKSYRFSASGWSWFSSLLSGIKVLNLLLIPCNRWPFIKPFHVLILSTKLALFLHQWKIKWNIREIYARE